MVSVLMNRKRGTGMTVTSHWASGGLCHAGHVLTSALLSWAKAVNSAAMCSSQGLSQFGKFFYFLQQRASAHPDPLEKNCEIQKRVLTISLHYGDRKPPLLSHNHCSWHGPSTVLGTGNFTPYVVKSLFSASHTVSQKDWKWGEKRKR